MPTIWMAINAVFSLRVDPWCLNFINEMNLRTFELAFINEKKINSALTITFPVVVRPSIPRACIGMTESVLMATVSALVVFPTPSDPTRIAPAP